MKKILLSFVAALIAGLPAPIVRAEDAPAVPPKTEEKKPEKTPDAKDLEREKDKLKKEVESYTKRLKGEAGKKLWEVVTKGSDDELKATGLKPEAIEALKTERPNLKGWEDVLTNEKLGKEVIKGLTDYGSSSKFTKSIEDEAKAKEKADKEKDREKKKARKEREKEKDKAK